MIINTESISCIPEAFLLFKSWEIFLNQNPHAALGLGTIVSLFEIDEIDKGFVAKLAEKQIIKTRQQNEGMERVCPVGYVPVVYAAYRARKEYSSPSRFRWENVSSTITEFTRNGTIFTDKNGQKAVNNVIKYFAIS